MYSGAYGFSELVVALGKEYFLKRLALNNDLTNDEGTEARLPSCGI